MDSSEVVTVTVCLSAAAAALYLLGRSSEKEAEELKSVTRVKHLQDLTQLLDDANKVSPFLVTISGRVRSDTPIKCKYSNIQGVIVKTTAEQHFLNYDCKGLQKEESAPILSTCKEVPWYLGDGNARVYVDGARRAGDFELTFGGKVFEESRVSLGCRKKDCPHGVVLLGVKRIEHVLPTGTRLTVVGEAIKDDNGTVRIQRPFKGPFYVTHGNIDGLIANLENLARCYKYASIGSAAIGFILIVGQGSSYLTNSPCEIQ